MATSKRIDSLSDLRKAIDRYTGGSSSTDWEEAKLDAIQMCEDNLNSRLRVPEMVKRAEAPIDQAWEGLPPDAESIIDMVVREPSGNEYTLISSGPEPRTAPAGVPLRAYVEGLIMELYPAAQADAGLIVRTTYYGLVPDIWGDEPCNDLLIRHPTMYLYGALRHLGVFSERVMAEIAGITAAYERELAVANQRRWKQDRRVAINGIRAIA